MMRSDRSTLRSRGFSLLEVLAAFVILALVVTALFGLFSGALGNASVADEYSRALLLAESRLAEAASAMPLVEATQRGDADDGRIQWETRVKAWEPPNVAPDLAKQSESMATRLYRVEVDVRFPGPAGRERNVSLATVKLGPRDPR